MIIHMAGILLDVITIILVVRLYVNSSISTVTPGKAVEPITKTIVKNNTVYLHDDHEDKVINKAIRSEDDEW